MRLDDVFLWNCRGDVLFENQDGCTSVASAHQDGRRVFVGHNEDGDPFLRGRCWIVDVQPQDGGEAAGYVSFYYPGSLPGHTFGVSRAGIVQTINNLRCLGERTAAAAAAVAVPGVPRMVLCRAVLDCRTLDEAVGVLRASPHAGAFHHLLASTEEARVALLSVEVAQGEFFSVVDVSGGRRRYGHANHAVHPGGGRLLRQIVTESSGARQRRVDEIIEGWPAAGDADGGDVLAALRDTQGPYDGWVHPLTEEDIPPVAILTFCYIRNATRRYVHACFCLRNDIGETSVCTTLGRSTYIARPRVCADTVHPCLFSPTKTKTSRGAGALPILRSAWDDPDEENTLATALFELSLDDASVQLQVFDRDSSLPVRTLTAVVPKKNHLSGK